MPQQVSVFAENKPGKIVKITSALKEASINIQAITIADAGDYGIIKLLLDNAELGCEVLKKNGVPATLKEIVAVKMKDQVGGLHEIASQLTKNNINVQDAYGFILEKNKEAVFVFQVDEISKAENILVNSGFEMLSNSSLYS